MFVINEGQKLHTQLDRMYSYTNLVDIVIADGGSNDGSLDHDILKSKKINTLLIKKSEGALGAQMRMGFDWALFRKYEGVIIMDGNNKDDPKAIPYFINLLDLNYDHIQGSRFIKGGISKNLPIIRWLGLKFIHIPMLNIASGYPFSDTTNGFRAYSRKLLTDPQISIFRDCFTGYELHYYLAIQAARNGYKIIETPTSRIYPSKGPVPTKISPFKGNLNVIFKLIKTSLGFYDPTSFYKKNWFHFISLLVFLILILMVFINSIPKNGWDDLETNMLITNSSYHKGLNGISESMSYPFTTSQEILMGEKVNLYKKQFGIIPVIFSFFISDSKETNVKIFLRLRLCLTILTALSVFYLIFQIYQLFGSLPAFGTTLFSLTSKYLSLYSHSLYWALFIPIFASALGLKYFRCQHNHNLRIKSIPFILWGLIFLRALAGYEFITVSIFLFSVLISEHQRTFKSIMKNIIFFSSAFLSAFTLHFIQLCYTSSFNEALKGTIVNAWNRTAGSSVSLQSYFFGIYSLFAHDKILVIIILLFMCSFLYEFSLKRKLNHFLWIKLLIFLSPLTWFVSSPFYVAYGPQYIMNTYYFGPYFLLVAFSMGHLKSGN